MVAAERRADPLVGQRVGRYRLCARLAAGGMATVYLARLAGPSDFRKWVAIKVIHPHLSHDPSFVQMFLDEARIASRIQHPNVCSVTDFGDDGHPYIVMEYMHGEGLGSIIKRCARDTDRPMPTWLFARVLAEAAMGLHAAHELKDEDGQPMHLVHRDVSPQNLFVLYDGHAKIMDFGVARARGRLTETRTGEIKGKMAYMSPEQLEHIEIDRRSDVWALGVILFEATTGRRLFRDESDAQTLRNVVEMEIPRPSTLADDYPPALEQLVLDTLQRDPAARPQTAAEFASRLEAYLFSLASPSGAGRVQAFMHERFGDRLDERDEFLRREGASWSDDSLEFGSRSDISIGGLRERETLPAPDVAAAESTGGRRVGAGLVAALAALGLVLGGAVVALAYVALGPDEVGATTAGSGSDTTAGSGSDTTAGSGSDPAADLTEPRAVPDPSPGPSAAPEPAAAGQEVPTGVDPPEAPEPVVERAEASPPSRPRRPPDARPGSVSLLAIPPAEVYLRGRRIGRTPLMEHELPAGTHVLELRPVRGGEPQRVRLRVRPGENTSRSVSL